MRERHAAEAVDALLPVAVEARIDDAVARSVEESVLVGDDADVVQVVEEDERSELELLTLCRRRELLPEAARRASLERQGDGSCTDRKRDRSGKVLVVPSKRCVLELV